MDYIISKFIFFPNEGEIGDSKYFHYQLKQFYLLLPLIILHSKEQKFDIVILPPFAAAPIQ